MDQIIQLVDTAKNEVGKLIVTEDGKLEIIVSKNFTYLENELKRLGETISLQKNFSAKKTIQQDKAILEAEVKVEKNDKDYMKAMVDFINKCNLIKPRVFAIIAPNKEVKMDD